MILMNRGGEKMGRRMGLFIISSIIFISLLPLRATFAQTMGGGNEITSPTSQAPSQETQTPPQGTNVLEGQPNSPVIDNNGIAYPRENLNPFGLSTLGG